MNKMIISFAVLFNMIIPYSSAKGINNPYDDSIKSKYHLIVINYVSFRIETPMTVNCNDFNNAFGSDIKTKILMDSCQIDSLGIFLNKFEISDDKYFPDVRVQIFLIGKDMPDDVLCMSELGIVFNGIPMKRNEGLLNFIKRKIQVK